MSLPGNYGLRSLLLFARIALIFLSIFSASNTLSAQTNEPIDSGSYIINMGVVPQTIENGLKPYGLVYDLIHTHGIQIKWVINPTKGKDGIDFSHDGTDYRGGPFIVPALYRSAAVDATIAAWNAKGVVGAETVSEIVVPVYSNLNYFVIWTLDELNGKIAEDYFANAEIPETAYNWLDPLELSCCNDIFIMPHADPDWSSHSRLYYWNESEENGGCRGAIWAGCHAVSAMEAVFNPMDPTEQMNFLSSDPGLILWKDHKNGTLPYTYNYHSDPIMQFMGSMDDAIKGGSEQIFIPETSWRSSTSLGMIDPDHPEALGPEQIASPLAWGRGLGDEDRGYVVY
ncbi:MAG: hypothetical protein KJP00_11025, partial [Bacteroidia bacterium]|nr:hypothetical protein [Bacteroidia bacterium]